MSNLISLINSKTKEHLFDWLDRMFMSKHLKNAKKFRWFYHPNPNKVSINWNDKSVVFDDRFSDFEPEIKLWFKRYKL